MLEIPYMTEMKKLSTSAGSVKGRSEAMNKAKLTLYVMLIR